MKINENEGRAEVYTPYSAQFVSRLKQEIGGAKWDGGKRCWTIPSESVSHCRGIMKDIFGETDQPSAEKRIRVRITFLRDHDELRGGIWFFGKEIARARGRDSGAVPGNGVVFEKGTPRSSGSMRNWLTLIPKGAIVVIPDVPVSMYEKDKNAVNEYGDRIFEAEVIHEEVGARLEIEKLKKEKERLLARINEIDRILAEKA